MSDASDRGFALPTLPATAKTPQSVLNQPGVHNPDSLPVLSPVSTIDIDVTEDCNLACLYCFKGEMFSKHMSLATMKRSLEWLLAASAGETTVACNFMGGEPTMRWPVIREFVPWARRRGLGYGKQVLFSMTTNLTLFTDEIRSFVDEYGFGVLMSIDGCPEVQDLQRPAKNGKPTSHTVEKWARSMLTTRPGSTARSTIHPNFVHRMAEGFKYLHQLGFRDIAMSGSEYNLWGPAQLDCLHEQVSKMVQHSLSSLATDRPVIMTVMKYYINKLIHPRKSGRQDDIKFLHAPCGAGKGYMMVDYTGDIWPCHRFDGADTAANAGGQFRLGNIFKAGFNDKLQQAFLSFDHQEVHKPSCTTCPVNPVCGGYCPAANLSDTGSIYTPHDTFCAWSQEMYDGAEELYDAARDSHPSRLDSLVELCSGVENDGQR